MTQPHAHATHPAPVARLRRADGLRGAGPGLMETGKPCLLITQQLQAAEKAVLKAKARYL